MRETGKLHVVLGREEAKYQKKRESLGQGHSQTLLIRCLDWTVMLALIILLNTYVI